MDFLVWKTSYSSLQIQTFGTIKIICSRQAKFNQTVVNYFLIKKIKKQNCMAMNILSGWLWYMKKLTETIVSNVVERQSLTKAKWFLKGYTQKYFTELIVIESN